MNICGSGRWIGSEGFVWLIGDTFCSDLGYSFIKDTF